MTLVQLGDGGQGRWDKQRNGDRGQTQDTPAGLMEICIKPHSLSTCGESAGRKSPGQDEA